MAFIIRIAKIATFLSLVLTAKAGMSQKEIHAFNEFSEKAIQGDAEAQFATGECYFLGAGVEKDEAAALIWFKKADLKGHPGATYYIGEFSYFGLGGVKKNLDIALIYYEAAASHNVPEAHYALALAYDQDDGIKHDSTKSQGHLTKAAELGLAQAQFRLWTKLRGKPSALIWLRKAAEQNHALAQTMLGLILNEGAEGAMQDIKEAMRLFTLAAEQGNMLAQHNLGWAFQTGRAGEKNLVRAAYWFKKAADQGNTWSLREMGRCYHLGEGVPKDEIEAYAYLNLAGAKDEAARKELAALESGLTPEIRLLGQQRSKEIGEQIEAKKRGASETPEPRSLRKGA